MANAITSIRIICSFVLLMFPAFSTPFFIIYILAGISDMLDGLVARATNTASEFGSILDTIADFIFIVACFITMIPVLSLEKWMVSWILLIAFIKGINIVYDIVIHHRMISIHSKMNKITGLLLFILPVLYPLPIWKYSVIIVSTVATLAALQESYLIRTNC